MTIITKKDNDTIKIVTLSAELIMNMIKKE